MHKGCPNFKWVSKELISNDLEEHVDSNNQIVDILNKTEVFEELDDEQTTQEIDKSVTNNEE